MKLQILALSALLLGASQAAIVTTGAYSFDFGTTSGNATPFATDTTGNGHNITTNQASTLSASTGSPVSASATTIATPNTSIQGGIFGNALPYNYTSDWAATIWVRANQDTNGTFIQGDNAATGTIISRVGGNFSFSGAASTIAATVGTWNQVTMINFGGLMNYYVNNVQVATGVSTTAKNFTQPMIAFGQGGGSSMFNSSYDEMKVLKFDSATDSLEQVKAALGVPEPTVALLGGLGALALLRRRRA